MIGGLTSQTPGIVSLESVCDPIGIFKPIPRVISDLVKGRSLLYMLYLGNTIRSLKPVELVVSERLYPILVLFIKYPLAIETVSFSLTP